MPRGPERTPVIVARPIEWMVVCTAEGCGGCILTVPGASSDRWYAEDFGGRGWMKFGESNKCGRRYRVKRG